MPSTGEPRGQACPMLRAASASVADASNGVRQGLRQRTRPMTPAAATRPASRTNQGLLASSAPAGQLG
jgi:hypothetical protein